MTRKNFLKEKLKKGRTVIGTFAVIPSVTVTDIIASTGFDFVVIDCEHGPINFETAQTMVIACESRSISPVVRVSGVNEAEILKALDIGAHCLHIPNVRTVKDTRAVVEYSKYPPVGNRGFSPFTRAGGYSWENAQNLPGTANANTLLAIHIEGTEAVKNIDELIKIPALDIIFVGLFDLSKSLGIPGKTDSPKVTGLLKKIAQKVRSAGKYTGTIATNHSQLEKFVGWGIQYITYSVDCDILSGEYKTINKIFRKTAK